MSKVMGADLLVQCLIQEHVRTVPTEFEGIDAQYDLPGEAESEA